MQRLSMSSQTLVDARENLIHADLIAFKHPFYQVLSINGYAHSPNSTTTPSSTSPEISNESSSSCPKPANHYILEMLRSLS